MNLSIRVGKRDYFITHSSGQVVTCRYKIESTYGTQVTGMDTILHKLTGGDHSYNVILINSLPRVPKILE